LCPTALRLRRIRARNRIGTREKLSGIVNKTKSGELKHHEDKRDFFCAVRDAFRIFAHRTANLLGTAWAFTAAGIVILVWLVTGPIFHFSDTWQLIINTATTIITFLMVFLIQNTQNRDAKAMHLKLDELIRAVKGARNHLVDLENLSDDELKKLEEQFKRMRKQAVKDGGRSSDVAPVETAEPAR
jgi:low affinity Fe/Cu permease